MEILKLHDIFSSGLPPLSLKDKSYKSDIANILDS